MFPHDPIKCIHHRRPTWPIHNKTPTYKDQVLIGHVPQYADKQGPTKGHIRSLTGVVGTLKGGLIPWQTAWQTGACLKLLFVIFPTLTITIDRVCSWRVSLHRVHVLHGVTGMCKACRHLGRLFPSNGLFAGHLDGNLNSKAQLILTCRVYRLWWQVTRKYSYWTKYIGPI